MLGGFGEGAEGGMAVGTSITSTCEVHSARTALFLAFMLIKFRLVLCIHGFGVWRTPRRSLHRVGSVLRV